MMRFAPRPRRLRETLTRGILLLACVIAASCGGPENTGRFEIDGVDNYKSCLGEMFPFEPSFFAARERIDSVGLFMQSRARLGQDADLVYVELYSPEGLRDGGGGDVAVDYPPTRETRARGELDLQESCQDQNVSLAIRGSLQFEAFGTESNDRIVGELTDGTVVDARTGEVVARSLSGSWDFAVEITAPHRSYPTLRDDYPTGP